MGLNNVPRMLLDPLTTGSPRLFIKCFLFEGILINESMFERLSESRQSVVHLNVLLDGIPRDCSDSCSFLAAFLEEFLQEIRFPTRWCPHNHYEKLLRSHIVIMLGLRLTRAITSTRRFCQILRQGNHNIVPRLPADLIISKYLQSGSTSVYLPPKKVGIPDYRAYQQGSPLGSIIEVTFKEAELSLVSMNYHQVNMTMLDKLLNKLDPDIILVVAPPQKHIPNFTLLPKTPDGVFSDVAYFDQICLKGPSITERVLPEELADIVQGIVRGEKIDLGLYEPQKSLLLASNFAINKHIPLMLADLPEQPRREWTCNSHTLQELQEILRKTGMSIADYEYAFQQPALLATLLFPQFFLGIPDRYAATLVEMAIAKQYKRITVLCGLMQNEAIEELLVGNNQSPSPVIQFLVPIGHTDSILRSITCWEIIQKHILLDVLTHGENVMHVDIQQLDTTTRMMEHYGLVVGGYTKESLLQFRYDKTLKYVDVLKKMREQGEKIRRKMAMREAIRKRTHCTH